MASAPVAAVNGSAAARRAGAAALSEILLAEPSLFRRAPSGVRGDLALAQSHYACLQ
jgi:hypothetical protein